MGVVDTIMVGRISAGALAAVALGNLYSWAVLVFGMGVLAGLDPIVSQAVGARDTAGLSRGMQRGLLLAALLTAPTMALMLPSAPFFRAAWQPGEVIPLAAGYVRVSAWGVFPIFAFSVLRQGLQATETLRPVVLTVAAANAINAGLNWIFVFGNAGFPAMGPVGSSWATALSRWAMLAGLLAFGWRRLRPSLVPLQPGIGELVPLGRMFRLGVPIGFQYVLELGAFGAIALLMGYLGTRDVAAHQIAINVASLTFMVPLGVSVAAAVRVGHAVGRSDPEGARRSARAALILGVGFMTLTAVVLVLAPALLTRAYTTDAAVAAVTISLLPIAGFFQVFDGLQVVATGILRGLGDTRAPMIVNVLGFWLIGMPVSLILAFRIGAGAEGLWWGLVAGLASVAVLLLGRVVLRLRRGVARLNVERAPG